MIFLKILKQCFIFFHFSQIFLNFVVNFNFYQPSWSGFVLPLHNLHHQGDDDGHVDNEGDDDWEDVDHVDCDICDDFVVLKA